MERNRSTRSRIREEINDDELFADLEIKKKSAKVEVKAVTSPSTMIKKNPESKKSKSIIKSSSKKRGKSTSSINIIKNKKSGPAQKNISASSKLKEAFSNLKISDSMSVDNHLSKSKKNAKINSSEQIYRDTKINLKVKKSVKNNSIKKSESNFEKNSENLTVTEDKTNISPLIDSYSSNTLGPKCIRLGLCCLNNYLRAKKETVFCSRTLVLSTYKSKGKIEAIARATQNVKDIVPLLKWNHNHHIHVLRLSSDLFPHYTNVYHLEKDDLYTLDFAKEHLEEAGKLARELGHRITMHPGQFNVVGTPNEEIFEKTILDLKMHADILDMMRMDQNSVMVVHGGGTYGDKQKTIDRWIKNFYRLPECVQKRLVLENCEKNFNIIDCLKVNEVIGIPVVLDNHHFNCYMKMHPEEKFEDIRVYIKQVLDTWIKKGIRPKFHISNQAPERPTGTHSDYIQEFPDYYLEIPDKYGVGVDVMVEAKAKEAAIMDLYQRYRGDLLKHVNEDDIDHKCFEFNKEKMQAIKCHKCHL